jgi:hypothetical protein
MVEPGYQVTEATVGLHVVGMYRRLLGEYVGHCRESTAGMEAVEVGRLPAKRCTSLHLLGDDVRRVYGRIHQKLHRA